MNRKVGKFKLWQLLAIGGALGLIIYEFEKSKKSVGETPEGFVASNANPLAGGGGSGEGSALGGNQSPVAVPGEPGIPGPAGTPGEPGPIQDVLSPGQLAEVEGKLAALNQPLSKAALKPAPPNSRYPQTNSKGEKFRTIKKNGKTIHEYKGGRKVTVASTHKAPHRHPGGKNPNHKTTGAAERAPIHHGKPTRPKPHTTPKAAVARPTAPKPGATARPAKRRGHR